ncbi:5-methyltetrahydropteroyltriglutamate--homocysteine S-methyltransferase [Tichowtungia aerotolerans]|uniref:5-methyltetrahydropteroyltriglutamate--homocysteine methyltransferase n=1 Tax=Tichowtungia aerotolerans TaxID=2697043 RepID=A0A6P1M2H6_9BACT|nr:5-methyltetrahydropteroyltriglutamate--homocysteine S-methyltransferase [Tichowtungia aerotolerans]QHI68312.1 5-methyltetrahydropteroyltriglutamate--homocysteine S-methyltransferase [Tichowtungia aerotolerans]
MKPIQTRTLGYPRIGANRELKKAVEAYWAGTISQDELAETAAQLRSKHWKQQRNAGIDLIPSNDFSFYDHVLDTACLVGALPERIGFGGGNVDLPIYFTAARGVPPAEAAGRIEETAALEMTKWFDTNYHYLVPELQKDQFFRLSSTKPVDEYLQAKTLGIETVPVLLGPISFLLLSKPDGDFDALTLLERLLPVYQSVLAQLKNVGAQSVQLDEPVLALDLTDAQRTAFAPAYSTLAAVAPRIHLTSYFGGLRDNLDTALTLPVASIHCDAVSEPGELNALLEKLPADKTLSLGVVSGRNIWKNDYEKSNALISKAVSKLGAERVLVSSSSSLLHTPVSLEAETGLDDEVKNWLAFADEKLGELAELAKFQRLESAGSDPAWQANAAAAAARRTSPRIHVPTVKTRCAASTPDDAKRQSPFAERIVKQQDALNFPLFPTTTIGSFPQTTEIRQARAKHRKGELGDAEYTQFLKNEIRSVVREQEELGLDCLVHGEPERNDMVEYFGQQLEGYVFSRNGWVQSYGSRCVKPPILFGDVSRPKPMTVDWAVFAQSLTETPMKGMLTGPVTILQWSFVRDDQPRAETMKQIAFAIRDEVNDLEAAGIKVIQIDEPALREGLPLRRTDHAAYLSNAVEAFRISTSGVHDETQIHTHMCYCEFNEVIDSIAALDADVISIEASRSRMELLGAFQDFNYPNQIGPGVWDIHSPRVPSAEEMVELLQKAAQAIPAERLWVNPDCGLKTRAWPETRAALTNMVAAAKQLRA